MSGNYPEGTGIGDPRAPWNEVDFPQCGICGGVHAPRRTVECCDRKACSDCRRTCNECGEWTCTAHLTDGFCDVCVKKFAAADARAAEVEGG